MDYTDRVAIVTGASSGIGRQVAIDLAARGARTAILARRRDALQATFAEVSRHSPDSMMLVGDVSDRATAEELVTAAAARYGRVDLLVNNAGVTKRKHVARLSVEEIEQVMRINFFGAVYCTLAVLPLMLQRQEGFIVNISSLVGRFGNPREAAYCASKFAMTGFSECAYYDLKERGVHVGYINTGPIDTEIWSHDEEPTYHGHLFPPQVVSRAVFRCVEKRLPEVTAPWYMRFPLLLHVLAPRLMRRGMLATQARTPGPNGAPGRASA